MPAHDVTNENGRSSPRTYVAADADQDTTLVPMLLWGLGLIVVGSVLVMAFV